MKEKSNFDWKYGNHAVVKKGWEDEELVLFVLGPAIYWNQWWVPVVDVQDGEPSFHKEAGLEKEDD